MTDESALQGIQAAIDDAIAASGGKQALLAAKLGCAQQTVSKLRSGEIDMTADWALRLAAAVANAVPAARFYPPLAALASAGTLEIASA